MLTSQKNPLGIFDPRHHRMTGPSSFFLGGVGGITLYIYEYIYIYVYIPF